MPSVAKDFGLDQRILGEEAHGLREQSSAGAVQRARSFRDERG
jgi:hypothetical protein